MRWATYPGDREHLPHPATYVLVLVVSFVVWVAVSVLAGGDARPEEPLPPAVYVVDPTVQAERVP